MPQSNLVSFRALQANVTKLNDPDTAALRKSKRRRASKSSSNLYHSGRSNGITRAMHEDRISFYEFQEPRDRETSVCRQEGFVVASSAATPKRVGGCRIGVATSLDTGKGTVAAVGTRNVRVVYSDPRRLVVALRALEVCASLVSLHAPQGVKIDELHEWWSETQSRRLCH